jgi:hypothetical protein
VNNDALESARSNLYRASGEGEPVEFTAEETRALQTRLSDREMEIGRLKGTIAILKKTADQWPAREGQLISQLVAEGERALRAETALRTEVAKNMHTQKAVELLMRVEDAYENAAEVNDWDLLIAEIGVFLSKKRVLAPPNGSPP